MDAKIHEAIDEISGIFAEDESYCLDDAVDDLLEELNDLVRDKNPESVMVEIGMIVGLEERLHFLGLETIKKFPAKLKAILISKIRRQLIGYLGENIHYQFKVYEDHVNLEICSTTCQWICNYDKLILTVSLCLIPELFGGEHEIIQEEKTVPNAELGTEISKDKMV